MINRSINALLSFKTLFVLLALLVISSCKSTENVKTSTPKSDISELEALYWQRVEESQSFTEAGVKFMTGMIGHHAQAIIMSRLAPENAASEQVKTLASRIINAQKAEIITMQRWLRDREQPVPQVHIDGLKLMIHGVDNHHSHMNMPGMLSQEQLQQLANAQGTEFDRLYLTYMIQHHQGAVHMVKNFFSTDGAAQDVQAYHLASGIQVDQKTEIARMNRMLDDLPQNKNL